MPNCPLCGTVTAPIDAACTELKIAPGTERFFRCDCCGSVSVPEQFHLTEHDERDRYGNHDNQANNSGYRNYLLSVISSVEQLVPDLRSKRILDYGAGENAVLTAILREQNVDVTPYDPNYENLTTLDGEFDCIIACESVEHFRDPLAEFQQMADHLSSGGYIWIRTEHLESAPYFSAWWYKNDETHIFFYSEKTMQWIAERFDFELIHYDEKNISLFRKR